MDPQVVRALLSPFVLALLGLCIGSFLNVVIHRLPMMMERGWRLESAELLGVKIDAAPAITLSVPRSRCPAHSPSSARPRSARDVARRAWANTTQRSGASF